MPASACWLSCHTRSGGIESSSETSSRRLFPSHIARICVQLRCACSCSSRLAAVQSSLTPRGKICGGANFSRFFPVRRRRVPFEDCSSILTDSLTLTSIALLLLRRSGRSKLVQSDPLAQPGARVHHELAALTRHTHLLVADLAEQVHALARQFPERRVDLALRKLRLQRPPQRRLRAEEAIRRHEAVDPLVRAEVVVVRDPVREALACVREILRV